MGLSADLASFRKATAKLTSSQNALKRNLLNVMRKAANDMQRYSRAMAPRETGSLEGAIYANVVNDPGNLHIHLYVSENKARTGFDMRGKPVTGKVGDYAGYMNSGSYNLRARSVAKAAANLAGGSRFRVGNNFIKRAGQLVWKRSRDDILEAARRAGFEKGRGR